MSVTFPAPIDFDEAVKKLQSKNLLKLAPEIGTQELRDHISSELRDRSFFSARVMDAQILQAFKDGATSILTGESNVAKQRLALKDLLDSIDYQPENPDDDGTMKDLSSNDRLNVMLKTNVATVQGFGQWQQGNREGALDAFPALELLPSDAKVPREDWDDRWQAALDDCGVTDGATEAGSDRLVALKNHPIWQSLGDGAGGYRDTLGNPFPPFAFGSERYTEDVDYEDAVDLGVMEADDDPLQPTPRGMNDGLESSIAGLDPEFIHVLQEGLSSFVHLVDGTLKFKNDARDIRRMRDRGEAVLKFLNSFNSDEARDGKGRWTGMVFSSGKGSTEDYVDDSNGNGQPVDRYNGSKGIHGFVEWDTDKDRYYAKQDHEAESPDQPFVYKAEQEFPRIRQVEGGKTGTGRTLYLEALKEAKDRGYGGLHTTLQVHEEDGSQSQGHTDDAEHAQLSLLRRGLITRSAEGDLAITPEGESFLKQRAIPMGRRS